MSTVSSMTATNPSPEMIEKYLHMVISEISYLLKLKRVAE